MCRHLGYLGEPVTLAELVLDPPHSLLVQSYAPKDMRGGGKVNADGFGAGWFALDGAGSEPAGSRPSGSEPAGSRPSGSEPAGSRPSGSEPAGSRPSGSGPDGSSPNSEAMGFPPSGPQPFTPAQTRQYRRAVPIWQDAAFPDLARATTATGALAAVRNATAGMPIADAACAPFADGRWLFSLNGYLAGWPDTAAELAADLPHRDLLGMQVVTDSVLLWTLLRRRLAGGNDPAAVLGGLVAEVLAAAPGSRLTTLLTDGQRLYATTVVHSLSARHSADGVLLASEPLDDHPDWEPIPDGQLVVADRGGVRYQPLP